jgi:hypothetical protein
VKQKGLTSSIKLHSNIRGEHLKSTNLKFHFLDSVG